MELEPTPHRLILELEALQADFHELEMSARDLDTHGHDALLASTAFALRARETGDKARRLFNQAARVLRSVEEARHIRWRLLQTSEHLAALFRDDTAAPRTCHRGAFSAQLRKPTLWDLLYVANRRSRFYGGMSLHEQVLAIAAAARDALRAWGPPPR